MDVLTLTPLDGPTVGEAPVEVVERKGKGHPDTICDALAEGFSQALVRHYRDHFGVVQHHNVDKVLLWAGAAEPRFGGGRVVEPMTVFLSGRATLEVEGETVPVEDLAVESARAWLGANLHALDPRRHVNVRSLVRGGSKDLVELFRRQARTGKWLANDTSFGVGFAPLTALEQTVLQAEQALTRASTVQQHPELGEDVKIAGIRRGDTLDLIVGTAMVDRHIKDLDAYREATATAAQIIQDATAAVAGRPVRVQVNAADDLETGSVYLTVTGTSAEAGDDGQVGRGNRIGGLITPYRPMVMEAAAGKNPLSHPGKLYGILAHRMAHGLVDRLPEVTEAHCLLVSRIGHPLQRPALAEIRLRAPGLHRLESLRPRVEQILEEHLDGAAELWREIVEGSVTLF
jgi:S-adenosylmethionine synthetase